MTSPILKSELMARIPEPTIFWPNNLQFPVSLFPKIPKRWLKSPWDQVTDGADCGIVKDQGVRQLDPWQLIGEAIAELHGLKSGVSLEELMIVDIVLW